MMAIIQEDENSNTSRRRVVNSSDWIIVIIRELRTTHSPRLYKKKRSLQIECNLIFNVWQSKLCLVLNNRSGCYATCLQMRPTDDLPVIQCGIKWFTSSFLCITLVKIQNAALQKKERLTSKYISKFQMWFIAKGWCERKVKIEIKKELTKASHS
jgi:hypothetical protein